MHGIKSVDKLMPGRSGKLKQGILYFLCSLLFGACTETDDKKLQAYLATVYPHVYCFEDRKRDYPDRPRFALIMKDSTLFFYRKIRTQHELDSVLKSEDYGKVIFADSYISNGISRTYYHPDSTIQHSPVSPRHTEKLRFTDYRHGEIYSDSVLVEALKHNDTEATHDLINSITYLDMHTGVTLKTVEYLGDLDTGDTTITCEILVDSIITEPFPVK